MCRYEGNIASSPLLALPPEIRDRVYKYILSNKLIHISIIPCLPDDVGAWSPHYFHNSSTDVPWCMYMKLSHTICYADPGIDDMLYERSLRCENLLAYKPDGTWAQPRTDVYDMRHNRCEQFSMHMNERRSCERWKATSNDPLPQNATLDLSILKTCRQIYKEAALTPLASNTFSFDSAAVLEFFLSTSLLGRQRAVIRRLHYHHRFQGLCTNGVRQHLQASSVALLTGLERLYVFLVPSGNTSELYGIAYDQAVPKFIPLRIKDVRVIVSPPLHVRNIGRKAREEAIGWEELLRTGGTEYQFKW